MSDGANNTKSLDTVVIREAVVALFQRVGNRGTGARQNIADANPELVAFQISQVQLLVCKANQLKRNIFDGKARNLLKWYLIQREILGGERPLVFGACPSDTAMTDSKTVCYLFYCVLLFPVFHGYPADQV